MLLFSNNTIYTFIVFNHDFMKFNHYFNEFINTPTFSKEKTH